MFSTNSNFEGRKCKRMKEMYIGQVDRFHHRLFLTYVGSGKWIALHTIIGMKIRWEKTKKKTLLPYQYVELTTKWSMASPAICLPSYLFGRSSDGFAFWAQIWIEFTYSVTKFGSRQKVIVSLGSDHWFHKLWCTQNAPKWQCHQFVERKKINRMRDALLMALNSNTRY